VLRTIHKQRSIAAATSPALVAGGNQKAARKSYNSAYQLLVLLCLMLAATPSCYHTVVGSTILLLVLSFHRGATARRPSSTAFLSLVDLERPVSSNKKIAALQKKLHSATVGNHCGGVTSCFGDSALFANNQDPEEDLPEPRTGWNHNTPDETSPFWEQPNGAPSKNSKTSPSTSGSNDNVSKIRTGWLHNTEPTPRAKEMRKEEKIFKLQRYGGYRKGLVVSSPAANPNDALTPFMICEVDYGDSSSANGAANGNTNNNNKRLVAKATDAVVVNQTMEGSDAAMTDRDIYQYLNEGSLSCQYDDEMIKSGIATSQPMQLLERVSISSLLDFSPSGRRNLLKTLFAKNELLEPTYEEVSITKRVTKIGLHEMNDIMLNTCPPTYWNE
jgi:hypothetical protein